MLMPEPTWFSSVSRSSVLIEQRPQSVDRTIALCNVRPAGSVTEVETLAAPSRARMAVCSARVSQSSDELEIELEPLLGDDLRIDLDL